MKILLFCTIIFLSFESNAQQEHVSSMFWNNYSEINPATVGLVNKQQAILSYRNQWPSLSGNERVLFANYNARIGRHHGVGGNITSGTVGSSEFQEVQANYSYQHIVGSRRISIGVGPSYNRTVFSSPLFPIESRSNTLNFNTGVAYQGKTILAGVGATQLFALNFNSDSIGMNLTPHYYAHFRNIFILSRTMEVYLEGIYRLSNGFQALELNARIVLFNKLMFGIGYRGKDTYSAQLGWDIDDHFRIAYANDRTINKLSNGAGVSHEFSLGYVVKYRVRKGHAYPILH
ncbi:MAG: type IX secretion system PorP/SprF family membrane protein [Crocinitomicaceae bacterium]|jgi:type IX secretion system PorP/SprF family membrane protein